MKKSPIMRQDAQRQRIIAIGAIARATEFFAESLKGIGAPDVDAAIERAVDSYVNNGISGMQAVVIGVRHAEDIILHRKALLILAQIITHSA